MALILIVNDESIHTSTVQSILIKNYRHEAVVKESANDIISFVEMLGRADIIVTPERTKKEFISEKLANYLMANKELYQDKIKLVVLGKNDVPYVSKFNLDPRSSAEKIAHTCSMLATSSSDNGSSESSITNSKLTTVFQLPKGFKSKSGNAGIDSVDQSYAGINVYYFYSVNDVIAEFNYYACVKKGTSVEYQLKFEKGKIISKTEIAKLFQGFAPKLFVTQNEYYDAIASLTRSFLNNFKTSEVSNDTRFHMNKNCYHILCHQFSNHNVDQFTLELVKYGLKSFEKLTNCPESINIFKELLHSEVKFDYAYLHAHFTCVLLYQFIDSFEWSKNFTKNKLLYFSFFHDLSLGSHRLIKMHHNYHESLDKISEAENKLILEHADMTAKTLESVITVPKEFVGLIREHHGMATGIGFATQLNPRTSPLSKMIFIVESFVTLYLNEFANKQFVCIEAVKAIIEKLATKYRKPGYSEVSQVIGQHANSLVVSSKTK